MCTYVCVRACGGQAGGVKGRFPNHLFWSFLETQSTLEALEAGTRLPASLVSSDSGCRTAAQGPARAWDGLWED